MNARRRIIFMKKYPGVSSREINSFLNTPLIEGSEDEIKLAKKIVFLQGIAEIKRKYYKN